MRMLYKLMSNPVQFHNSNIKLLVIENKAQFRNTILSLSANDEENFFVFSKDYKPLDFSKSVRFIGDVLFFNLSDKKLMNKINSDLEYLCNTKYFDEISEIKELCTKLCYNLCEEKDFDFSFNDEIETSAFIKLFLFSPNNDSSNIYEKLLLYINLVNKYLGIKCFVTQNLHIYFDDEELSLLYNTLIAHDIYLVNIENVLPTCINSFEEVIIIDKDLCEVIDKID